MAGNIEQKVYEIVIPDGFEKNPFNDNIHTVAQELDIHHLLDVNALGFSVMFLRRADVKSVTSSLIKRGLCSGGTDFQITSYTITYQKA